MDRSCTFWSPRDWAGEVPLARRFLGGHLREGGYQQVIKLTEYLLCSKCFSYFIYVSSK